MSGRGHGILKNAFTVGAFTALSRVLGLVREMLQSRLIGAGVAQSAFTLAFALPNMMRKLFGEGALTAAFVPVFKGELERSSREAAAALARSVMTMVVLMLGAILVLALGSLEVVGAMRDRFGVEDAHRFALTIGLVKTLLPYMLFICAAAFGMGVVNALGRFKASSFMPCILNFVWIGTLLWMWVAPSMDPDRRIHRVAIAILCAGAVQMAFMFWMMAKSGFSPLPKFTGWGDAKVRLVWRNVGIAAVGAGAVQINYMLDQFLAQLASPWAAGVIGYAERLMDLPLGIVGVAFGTVLLPTLAGLFAKDDLEGAKEALSSSLVSLMFVMIPAAVGLAILAHEVTGVIYQGGEFDAVATTRVARALAVYSAGLAFFGLQKVAVPWFQAQNDMKTPLRVSVAAVVLNASLNIAAVLLLPVEWRHVGLAASTVVCAGAAAALLLALARRRNGDLGLSRAVPSIVRITTAALAMGGAIAALRPFTARLFAFAGERAGAVMSLGLLVVAGIASYSLCALVMMRGELAAMRRHRSGGAS